MRVRLLHGKHIVTDRIDARPTLAAPPLAAPPGALDLAIRHFQGRVQDERLATVDHLVLATNCLREYRPL